MISASAAKAVAAIFSQLMEFQQLEFQKTTLRSIVSTGSFVDRLDVPSSIGDGEAQPSAAEVWEARPEDTDGGEVEPRPDLGGGLAKTDTVADVEEDDPCSKTDVDEANLDTVADAGEAKLVSTDVDDNAILDTVVETGEE
jgi:hypothetical protein